MEAAAIQCSWLELGHWASWTPGLTVWNNPGEIKGPLPAPCPGTTNQLLGFQAAIQPAARLAGEAGGWVLCPLSKAFAVGSVVRR